MLKSFLVVALIFVCAHAQEPPTDVWCEYVQLPPASELPFSFPQTVWWQEYYMLNVTDLPSWQEGKIPVYNVTFKVYASVISDAVVQIVIGTDYCPVFVDSWDWPNAYSPGVASATSNVTHNSSLVLLAHMSGGSYTIYVCEGNSCPEVCPNDCSTNGFCNVTTANCTCFDGWTGADCAYLIPPPVNATKIPFGSWGVFYSVVVGLPTLFVATAITVITILIFDRNLKRKMVAAFEKRPLLTSKNAFYGTSKMRGMNGGTHGANGDAHGANGGANGINGGYNIVEDSVLKTE